MSCCLKAASCLYPITSAGKKQPRSRAPELPHGMQLCMQDKSKPAIRLSFRARVACPSSRCNLQRHSVLAYWELQAAMKNCSAQVNSDSMQESITGKRRIG